MRDKVFFYCFAVLAALTLSPILGGLATGVGHLAGMDNGALVVLFGTATAGAFASLMALIGLAAALFFEAKK